MSDRTFLRKLERDGWQRNASRVTTALIFPRTRQAFAPLLDSVGAAAWPSMLLEVAFGGTGHLAARSLGPRGEPVRPELDVAPQTLVALAYQRVPRASFREGGCRSLALWRTNEFDVVLVLFRLAFTSLGLNQAFS